MYSTVKDQNKKSVLLLLLVVIVLPLLILAASTIQDIRNRAAGSNEVAIKFSPSGGNYPPASNLVAKTVMNNISGRTIKISGAQAVINVSDKFIINSVKCLTPFDGLPFTKVDGQKVTVMCSIAMGATPVTVAGADISFASLDLNIDPNATVGTTADLTFVSTRATEAGITGQAPDVSTAGTPATFTISSGGSGGPSSTPEATGPTVTPVISGDVILSFNPTQVNLPPNATVKIMADSGSNNVAFTSTVITFDNTKLNLAGEIITNPQFSTVVEKTTMATANSQGRAKIVIASSPTDQPRTGSFEVATLTFKPVTNSAANTSVDFSTSEMQYVNSNHVSLTMGASSLIVNISETTASITPSGGDLEVPIGSKDQLTININGVNGPQITFNSLLANTQNNPDMYFRLRLKDELYFQDNPTVTLAPSCNTPNAAEKDFYVPMKFDGTVYKPVTSISLAPPGSVATVSSDGWVTLPGITPGRYYSILLKASKFRQALMAEHIKIAAGQNPAFDFVTIPLEPGDLPDPNNGLKQDCTVNSVDISLIASRIGSTVAADTNIADVNFDNIVNGNDVAKVVNTLSTKPDDDF